MVGWQLYAWLYLIGGLALGVISVLARQVTLAEILRNVICWLPSPVLVFAFNSKRRLLNRSFWVVFFFYILVNTAYDVLVVDWASVIKLGNPPLMNLAFNSAKILLFLPAFYVHFLYAFRPSEIGPNSHNPS